MKRNIPGGLLVFLGAMFWSLNSPIIKFLEMDSFLLCGLRALIAGIVLVPFLRPKQLCWNRWMLLYVVSYCGLSLFIILALSMTSAAVASGMQYTAVIWLFLLNWAVTRRIDLRSLAPVGVVLVGVVFFMSSGTEGSTGIGNLIALVEGIFFCRLLLSCL